MNRVFDIKSGHDFSRYRNSVQVICFQINDLNELAPSYVAEKFVTVSQISSRTSRYGKTTVVCPK